MLSLQFYNVHATVREKGDDYFIQSFGFSNHLKHIVYFSQKKKGYVSVLHLNCYITPELEGDISKVHIKLRGIRLGLNVA